MRRRRRRRRRRREGGRQRERGGAAPASLSLSPIATSSCISMSNESHRVHFVTLNPFRTWTVKERATSASMSFA
jgi:hypothetical protein